MTFYGAREIAASFRTVRNNTLRIAEEIPEDKYTFRPAEGARSIAETLVHISNIHRFPLKVHRDDVGPTLKGFNLAAFFGPLAASEKLPLTKAQIITRVTESGEEFESWVGSLTDDFLGESLAMPPGGSPASRTRFDMLIAVKEHEMHHRGQLMLMQRMIGLTPHLTRETLARRAAAAAALQSTAP
jgi:uncharacterized damage-inducible protein DinB